MTSITTDVRGRGGGKNGSGEEGLEGRESSSLVDMLPRSHGASPITTLTPVSSSTTRHLRRPASALTRYLSKPLILIIPICYRCSVPPKKFLNILITVRKLTNITTVLLIVIPLLIISPLLSIIFLY